MISRVVTTKGRAGSQFFVDRGKIGLFNNIMGGCTEILLRHSNISVDQLFIRTSLYESLVDSSESFY